MPIQQKFSRLFQRLQPVSAESKMFFIQHLGVMVKAGLSLHDALTTLAEEIEGKRFKRIIKDIAESVEGGKTLAESIGRHSDIFSELFTNMIRAGEVSGKLEETLRELHVQLAKEHTLKSKVRGALIYPTVIVVVMIAIAIFMMTVVLPRLISIFDTINATLPLSTQIVIRISKFATAHGILVALSTLVAITALVLFLRTQRGRSLFHDLLLRLPIIGGIVRKINLALFSRTLSSLLKTDIPFAQSLTIVSHVLGNVHYHTAVAEFAHSVKQGVTLETLLRKQPRLFPPLVRQMVFVGERTGTLDAILGEVATFYEEEVTTIMETLPALIEPLLIVVLGLGVAGLAVSIIMPMYSLAQQF